jgi:hypothetical protein
VVKVVEADVELLIVKLSPDTYVQAYVYPPAPPDAVAVAAPLVTLPPPPIVVCRGSGLILIVGAKVLPYRFDKEIVPDGTPANVRTFV